MSAESPADKPASDLGYQAGFGNEFATEAVPGALPIGQNRPQRPPLGLFSELISGATFTAPRAFNRRSFVFRIRPSVGLDDFRPLPPSQFKTPSFGLPPYPGPIRWQPFEPVAGARGDFLDSLTTLVGNGSPLTQEGMSLHIYRANRSMGDRVFADLDGEFLIVPQTGRLRIISEFGILQIEPSELAIIPRGIKFRVDLLDENARGWVCENYGIPFQLPELGPVGSTGLAAKSDFLTPLAAYEDRDVRTELVQKFAGNLWAAELDHSPFDVVAWRGNYAPCKYDMRLFMPLSAASFDHADPSIYSALVSPSSAVLGPNIDFLVLPPRWVVAEHTFRPPGFHRNLVAELLGSIAGRHESKDESFRPGSTSLHNNFVPHGPDRTTWERARSEDQQPTKLKDSLVFLIETRFPLEVTSFGLEAPERQKDYAKAWAGFPKQFSQPK